MRDDDGSYGGNDLDNGRGNIGTRRWGAALAIPVADVANTPHEGWALPWEARAGAWARMGNAGNVATSATVHVGRRAAMMWTTGQSDTIRELGFLGVRAVRDEILRRYGVRRSLHAVEVQASRIHASLRRQPVCPECGVVGLRLNRQSGLCPRCTERLRLEEAAAFNELLMEEQMEAADPSELEGLRREYAAMRQRNSRLCRKYGLKGLAERRRQAYVSRDAAVDSAHGEDEADIRDGGGGR